MIHFHHEDGGSRFLENVCNHIPNMLSQHRGVITSLCTYINLITYEPNWSTYQTDVLAHKEDKPCYVLTTFNGGFTSIVPRTGQLLPEITVVGT